MHIEAEEEKALWLWKRNEWEQGILFAIIPFIRMIYASTNWCRMTGPWPQRQFREDTQPVGKANICTGIEEGHLRNHRKWKRENKQSEVQEPGRNTETCAAVSLLHHSNSSQTGILQHLIKVPLECMSKFLRSRSGRSQQLPRQSQGRKIMTTQEQAGADCLIAEGIVLLWQSCDNLKWTLFFMESHLCVCMKIRMHA